MQVRVGELAPSFTGSALIGDDERTISLADYRGKWLVLFFYSEDFSALCPTEVLGFDKAFEDFQNAGVELVGASTDTVQRHREWLADIGPLEYPLMADPDHKISEAYGVYHSGEGKDLRGTFIIDPDGVVKSYSIHFFTVGRNVQNILTRVWALQSGGLTPCNWKPGEPTIKG